MALPPPQVPEEQVSPVVQNSPSSQALPSLIGDGLQLSVPSLQTPTLHCSSAPELSVSLPPSQVTEEQVSPVVQKAPSSQALPSLIGDGSQLSVPSLQTPTLH